MEGNIMAYCWLVKRKDRGGTFYLYFAKALGRKPFSLRTIDKVLAEEAKRRMESEIWCNERGIKRKVAERVRYGELIRRFVEHKQASGITPGSLNTYIRTLNRFGAFMGSDMYIDAITPEVLERFITHRRTSLRQCDTGDLDRVGKILRPKTIRNEAFTLVTLFTWACDRDLLLENPTRKMCKPKRVVYDAPRALTPDEYLRLKAAIREEYGALIDFYLLTGIRRSDGLNITSENFDFERMVATLPQSKQRNHKVIPISKDLAEVVRSLIDRVGVGKPFVHLNPSTLTVNFRKARIAAGLPASITFHSLRHTFASWLASLGADFKTLQSLIGHSSSEATQIYLHSFDKERRSAIEKLVLPKKVVNE
jgi:integrase